VLAGGCAIDSHAAACDGRPRHPGVLMKRFVLCALASFAVIVVVVADAHTTVESSRPPNEAVLAQSPPTIEIKFKHPVQMTSIVAVQADKTERKLAFTPMASAAVITLDNPALTAGRTEIRWKGLSKDGHVIDGTLVYTIKSTSASP
jgi:copper resistance protein C